jgi:hypothetical protein
MLVGRRSGRWHAMFVLAGVALLAAGGARGGEPRAINLNQRIQRDCGPEGYRSDSGCNVELGPGTYEISETVEIGHCTTTTVRNSLTLSGKSAGLMTTKPRFATAGTTLRWKGPRGAPMIEVCGASFLSLRDLTLDATGAAVGVRISADNSASAISHFVELRDVVIDGATLGVHVTGRNLNDQADFVTLERVSLANVDVGYLQDSGQSVGGRLETIEVTARRKGFEIRNGSLICEGCYVGTLPAARGQPQDFIAFHLGVSADPTKPWDGHHQVHIAHSHMELQRGKFIVEDAGALFPITSTGNSFSLQCPELNCEMAVVESQSRASLVMIGDVVLASSNPPAAPRARVCHRGELVRLGVFKKPEVSELVWSCAP